MWPNSYENINTHLRILQKLCAVRFPWDVGEEKSLELVPIDPSQIKHRGTKYKIQNDGWFIFLQALWYYFLLENTVGMYSTRCVDLNVSVQIWIISAHKLIFCFL